MNSQPLIFESVGRHSVVMTDLVRENCRIRVPPLKTMVLNSKLEDYGIEFPIYMSDVQMHSVHFMKAVLPPVDQEPRRSKLSVVDTGHSCLGIQLYPKLVPTFVPGNVNSLDEGYQLCFKSTMNTNVETEATLSEASIIPENTPYSSRTRTTKGHPICITLVPKKMRGGPNNFNDLRAFPMNTRDVKGFKNA